MNFYNTAAWKTLKKIPLKVYGSDCMRCGKTPTEEKPPHVDHVISRLNDKSLELEVWNLQVLCEHCNCTVKGARSKDYRKDIHIKLMEEYLNSKITVEKIEIKEKELKAKKKTINVPVQKKKLSGRERKKENTRIKNDKIRASLAHRRKQVQRLKESST